MEKLKWKVLYVIKIKFSVIGCYFILDKWIERKIVSMVCVVKFWGGFENWWYRRVGSDKLLIKLIYYWF